MALLAPGLRQRLVKLATILACMVALSLSLPLTIHSAPVMLSYLTSHARGEPLPADFLNYYTAGRTLLVQPNSLYLPDREADLQRSITGQPDTYAQFQNMPQVALAFVPLALLAYPTAYLVWAALNLALLALSAWLLAPRQPRWLVWPVWVVAVLACFGPAQLALVDGQTTFLALFGFCAWAAWLERGAAAPPGAAAPRRDAGRADAHRHQGTARNAGAGALWLLGWAWKPTLLPVPLAVLLLSRAWRQSVALVAIQGLGLAIAVVWSGSNVISRYVTFAQSAAQATASGQTVFGIVQALGSGGPLASLEALSGVAAVTAAIASVWWAGLRGDARRRLQLAVVPLGAVLIAPRALGYELTLWVATAWLVWRYLAEARAAGAHGTRGERARRGLARDWPLGPLLALSWLSAALIILSGGSDVVPWAGLAGLALLAALVREYHAWQPPTGATSTWPDQDIRPLTGATSTSPEHIRPLTGATSTSPEHIRPLARVLFGSAEEGCTPGRGDGVS